MEYFYIITGLFLILMGFLVKRFPNLIAGYNSLSPGRKKAVDIHGLSSWIRNGLIILGLLSIGGYYALMNLGVVEYVNVIIIMTLIMGTIFIAMGGQRYDHGS